MNDAVADTTVDTVDDQDVVYSSGKIYLQFDIV